MVFWHIDRSILYFSPLHAEISCTPTYITRLRLQHRPFKRFNKHNLQPKFPHKKQYTISVYSMVIISLQLFHFLAPAPVCKVMIFLRKLSVVSPEKEFKV